MYAVISISTVEHKLSKQHIRVSEQGSFTNMLIVHILLGTIHDNQGVDTPVL